MNSKARRSVGRHRAPQQNHLEVSTWLFAGAVTLGVCASVASGSGVAHAETSPDGATSTSASTTDSKVGTGGATSTSDSTTDTTVGTGGSTSTSDSTTDTTVGTSGGSTSTSDSTTDTTVRASGGSDTTVRATGDTDSTTSTTNTASTGSTGSNSVADSGRKAPTTEDAAARIGSVSTVAQSPAAPAGMAPAAAAAPPNTFATEITTTEDAAASIGSVSTVAQSASVPAGMALAAAAPSPSLLAAQPTILDPLLNPNLTPLQRLACDILAGVINATGPTLLNIFVEPRKISVEEVIIALITNQWDGRQIIGDGANGTADSPDGKPGGWILGNGGNGWSQQVAGSGLVGGNGGPAGLIGNGGNGGAGAAGVGTRGWCDRRKWWDGAFVGHRRHRWCRRRR